MSENSVNFIINVNGNAKQTITNIGKSMEGLTGTFTRLSAKLTLVNQATSWFSSAAQAMQGLVGTSLEFEQQQANLKTLLNGDEKAMQGLVGKIQEYGKATVYDRKGLVEAQKTMMAFGMDSEFAFSKLKNIGDIALGDSQKMQSLALAFAQATSSGKLMGQDLMQMINAGFNPLEVIAQKTGKSIGDLKEEMSKGAISADLLAQSLEWATEEGGRFYNGAENAAQTTAGKIAVMQDTIDEFKVSLFEATNGLTAYIAEIGNQLVPFAQLLPLVEATGKGLFSFAGFAKNAYTTLGLYNGYLSIGKVENLGFAKNVLQATVSIVRFATVGLFNAVKGIGAFILSLVTGGTASATFSTIASTAFGAFATAARTACTAVSTAIASIPIIGWVAIAVTAIGSLLVWLYQKFDGFAAFCAGLWAGICALFSGESFSDAYDKAYQNKLKEREDERKKEDALSNADAQMKSLVGSANAGLTTNDNSKKPETVGEKTNATATGGTRNTQITIHLGKFFDNMVFNGGFQENAGDIEKRFSEMLLRTLYSAYNS